MALATKIEEVKIEEVADRRGEVSAAGKVLEQQCGSTKGLPGHKMRIEGKVTSVFPAFQCFADKITCNVQMPAAHKG